ncbi:MAG: hypothetical protein ACREL5_13285 [Gemmatimonadales bacterium]
MTSAGQPEPSPQPRFGALIAAAVYAVAGLTLLYPVFTGKFLAGSDQVQAGYAFRALAEAGMHQTGHIPQWNPYIFGGMPLWAVPGHFDVFYPTAWLRWLWPADQVLGYAFFIHFIVAGLAMYALLRTLRASWTASLVGGLAYEFSGILASQVSPGHDGKLFAAALAPLALAALIRAIRHGRTGYFGWFALVIGLIILTPHYLAAYYILVVCALFTLWLVFLDPERIPGRSPVYLLGMAALAVVLGLGIAAVELIPVQHMVAYTARGPGGASLGYGYATTWAMAPEEIMTAILPQFNGMLNYYWGPNPIKDHTEYLGGLVVILAALGIPALRRRKMLLPVGGIAVLFLLVAFGGHTPFYRLWYLLPKMGEFRAPGLAFFVVALMTCVAAGLGVDRLLRGEVRLRNLLIIAGVLAFVAVLAVVGILQNVAESLVEPEKAGIVVANAPQLEAGGVRLLIVVLIGGGALWMIQRGAVRGLIAAAALVVVIGADNWSILRNFTNWLPPASITYADDQLTTTMKKMPMPFRAYSPKAPDNPPSQMNVLTVYTGGALMARGVPALLGYHGMEDRFFDDLLGGKNVWIYQYNEHIWDLYAVSFIIQSQEPPQLPGYHKVAGPAEVGDIAHTVAPEGVMFQRDSAAQWVRVVPVGVNAPDSLIPPTIADARFPLNSYVLFSDTAQIKLPPPGGQMPAPTAVTATLASWQPGSMTVRLNGSDTRTTYLLVAENWYPDWHATVDGKTVPTLRGDGAMLSVALPPGAKEVAFKYDIASYHLGVKVSVVMLLLTAGLCFADRLPFGKVNA